jgi:hypothetical protein
MEVHAHTHTARKKWAHYFWEFLMLFLAVFWVWQRISRNILLKQSAANIQACWNGSEVKTLLNCKAGLITFTLLYISAIDSIASIVSNNRVNRSAETFIIVVSLILLN